MFQHYAAIRYLIAPFVNAGHVLVRYSSCTMISNFFLPVFLANRVGE